MPACVCTTADRYVSTIASVSVPRDTCALQGSSDAVVINGSEGAGISVEDLHSRAKGSTKTRSAGATRFPRRTTGYPDAPHGPSLEVIQAKIRPPTLRPGVVPRGALLSRLRRDTAAVVTVVARAGYGKTTLLAQWAAAETRPVAWLSIDQRDNDPSVLVEHLVAAVDRAQPLDRRLLAALGGAGKPRWESVVARAAQALASCTEPFLLVVDNADLLHSTAARRVFSTLIARPPRGSTLALAGRSAPTLPLGALRARGGVRELGVEELALTRREAQLLLLGADASLSEQQIEDMIEVCEGWPVALYLASLSVAASATDATPNGFGGSDRYLAEYLRAEYLSALRPQDLRFLRRSSILGELTGPLCDAVLHEDDSEARLQRLTRANLVVVPLGRKSGRYRFHRLFREYFVRELLDEEPEAIPALHRRAADWYEGSGDPHSALEHAEAARDADRVAALISVIALPASSRGHGDEIVRRIARLGEAGQLHRYPALALQGSWVQAFRGRAAEAERWLELAERGARRRSREGAMCRAGLPVVRAALCRNGARRMLADSGAALASLPPSSPWYPRALHLRGCAAILLGCEEEADSLLVEAARAAALQGSAETQMIAVSQRSLIAWPDDPARAAELSLQASEVLSGAELESCPTAAIAYAASARTALRHGRWAEARQLVDAAEPLRSCVTEALPWLAVGVRLELAQCYLTLRDVEAARAVVAEIDAILDVRPRLGGLAVRARELRDELGALVRPRGRSRIDLTPAELRLLPLLATHLSFREIGDQLNVSRNTVKTQAISIYRKLGVSGRSDAIRVTGAGTVGAA